MHLRGRWNIHQYRRDPLLARDTLKLAEDSFQPGALVVGASMWVAISLGILWGASFPILLHRLGLDPAVSSSVFLTTMTDIVSFVLILGLASFFLLGLL